MFAKIQGFQFQLELFQSENLERDIFFILKLNSLINIKIIKTVYNVCKEPRLPISVGIVPVKPLFCKYLHLQVNFK